MSAAGIGTPYWYEWEIGLFKCVEMLWNKDIKSVIFQASKFDSIDDVVVNYNNGSTLNIQVKHTDVDNNFTFSTLLGGQESMLVKWAKDWQKNKDNHDIKEINIVTNKRFGQNKSKGICSFNSFVKKVLPVWKKDPAFVAKSDGENKAINLIKSKLSFLGDDLYNFIKILNFTESKNKNDLEEEFNKLLSKVLGTTNPIIISAVANNLYASLRIWTTSSREKEEVNREDVYKAICANQINNTEIPDFSSLYPEKPIFPSREIFKDEFLKHIKNTKSKIIFLKGLPGSGKTNFVSYLSQLKDSIIDFNFYTYIPVKRSEMFFSDDAGYYSGAYLWRCLLHQLKNKFENLKLLYELQFPLTYGYMNIQEMRETVLKYLGIYAEKQNRTCFVFIDGLDHAARSRETASQTFLAQLPTPEQISGNVKFVLVGQPLNDKYPNWLDNGNCLLDVVNLPSLTEEDVAMLLTNTNVRLPEIDLNNLSRKIVEVVGNNALNILFAIEELKGKEYDFDKLIDELHDKNLNCEISKYYEWILNSCNRDLLQIKILTIFSFITQKIQARDIATLCSCTELEVVYTLNSLYPLIQNEDRLYFVFHNDVRLYFKSKVKQNSCFASIIALFKRKIDSNENLFYLKYAFLFDACYELNDESIFEVFSPEYIIKSVLYNVPIVKLAEEFMLVFELVYKKQLKDKLVELSLCFNTLFQYVNCSKYNDVIEEKFVDYSHELVRSEKYCLNPELEFNHIIGDVLFLTQLNLHERARAIFNEYLDKLNIDWLASMFNGLNKRAILQKFGYVCRFYNATYIQDTLLKSTSGYIDFVSGWIEASKEFTNTDDLNLTFLFSKYYEKDLFDYIKSTASKLDLKALKEISHNIQKSNSSILILIEIGCALIIKGEIDRTLIDLIIKRKNELKTEGLLEFKYDKILYCVKLYFCIFSQISDEDKNKLFNLYQEILTANNIKLGDRGFSPAIAQFEIAKDIFEAFYKLKPTKNTVERLYDLAYFSEKYGAGSIHDSNSYAVMSFLNMVIFKLYELQNNQKYFNDACNRLLPLYIGIKPKFKAEFLPLFSTSKETKYLLSIANFWTSENGYVWQEPYSEVETICNAIIRELMKVGLTDEANRIDKIKKMKIVGYVGHKDYSLYDVFDWFDCMPASDEKFKLGIELLSISDVASNIGDNRASSSVVESLFKLAFELGIKYVDALFDLKNIPDGFYSWRYYLLTELDASLEYIAYTDDELLEIHKLLNSWINIQIERGKTFGNNYLDLLASFNNSIAKKLNNPKLRLAFLNKYPTPKHEESYYNNVFNKKKNNIEFENVIMETVSAHGLSEKAFDLIKQYIVIDDPYAYNFLAKIGQKMCNKDKRIYVNEIIIPYVINKNKFGFSGNGIKSLVDEYRNEISIDSYFELLRHSIKRLQNNDTDYYFSVNDDINILVLNFIKTNKTVDFKTVLKEKMETHRLWITSCGLLTFNNYIVNFDPFINSLADFNKKYLGK